MSAVLQALVRAFGQLADTAILRIVVRSVVVTLLVFAVFGLVLYGFMTWLVDWMGIADGAEPGLGWLNEALAVLATLVASWFLFRVVAVAVLQFFADQVVKAIEASDYPEAARHARALGFREEMGNSLRGIGRTLGLNLLALPVAGVLLVTGIGPAAVFFGVNAWLLGRELTDMAWVRYRSSPQELSPVPRTQRLMLGGAVAGIMLVPFINLVAPLIGAAAGTHLAHQAMQQGRKEAAAPVEDVGE